MFSTVGNKNRSSVSKVKDNIPFINMTNDSVQCSILYLKYQQKPKFIMKLSFFILKSMKSTDGNTYVLNIDLTVDVNININSMTCYFY